MTDIDPGASQGADPFNTSPASAGGVPETGAARTAEGFRGDDNAALSEAKTASPGLAPPSADAPREQWDRFYAQLGRPETPDAYEFALPEGLPTDMPYDGDSAARYKAWSHAAGLSPRQAQSLHDAFLMDQVECYREHAAALARRGEQAHGELVRAWGDKSSAGYAENVQFADRFIRNNGDETLLGELKANGLLSAEGVVLSPALARAFARAGRALYAEDQFVTGAHAGRMPDPARTLYPSDPFAPRR